jgi:hypothetical protein
MTATNDIELSSDLQALRASVSIDDARDLDRRREDRASKPNFNEARYFDTLPTLHMTATWGS